MTTPSRTLAQPHLLASSGCLRPSDWPMSVAVAVPKAMHAVKVSLSTSTMSVFAALLTASPVGALVELADVVREDPEAAHHDHDGDGRRERQLQHDPHGGRDTFAQRTNWYSARTTQA